MALVDTIQSAALDAGASASAPLAEAKVIQPAKAASTKASTKSTSKAKTEVLATEDTKDTEDK
mgnify:CR=1 FL=1